MKSKVIGYSKIPVSNLAKAPWNYKYNDAVLMAKLKENMKENGQIENLIVREIGDNLFEVVNGNHRLDVLLDLHVEEAYCYNLGKIPDNRAKRIAIETNETKFPVDSLKLGDILKDLMADFTISDLVVTMPYSAAELESLMKIDIDLSTPMTDADGNFESPPEKQPMVKSFYCPKCGFKYDTLENPPKEI